MMAFKTLLILSIFVVSSVINAQRPPYAGSRPVGYKDRFRPKPTAGAAAVASINDIDNRFGEDTTNLENSSVTQRPPVGVDVVYGEPADQRLVGSQQSAGGQQQQTQQQQPQQNTGIQQQQQQQPQQQQNQFQQGQQQFQQSPQQGGSIQPTINNRQQLDTDDQQQQQPQQQPQQQQQQPQQQQTSSATSTTNFGTNNPTTISSTDLLTGGPTTTTTQQFQQQPQTASTSSFGLGLNQINSGSGHLPYDAHGDAFLVNLLNQRPVDQRPFWLVNYQAIEAHRNGK